MTSTIIIIIIISLRRYIFYIPKTTFLGIYHVFLKFLNRDAQLLAKFMLILIKLVIDGVIVEDRV